MNLKQLEAFVKVTEGRSFSKADKRIIPDTADNQRTHCFFGKRVEYKAVCEEYKRGQPLRRWNRFI